MGVKKQSQFIYPIHMQTNATQSTIQKLLTTTPPAFSASESLAIAARNYGINGQVRPLVSDKDQNFRLIADDGHQYVLKILQLHGTIAIH